MTEKSNINYGECVSMYTKNEEIGYHASNDIFNNVESINIRFSERRLAMPQFGVTRSYYFFSNQNPEQVCFLTLRRGETIESDPRPYRHMELYYISAKRKPQYNYSVPVIIKALCEQLDFFKCKESDFAEAMMYIAEFIPKRMKEDIIFSFDDEESQDIIHIRETEQYLDLFTEFAINPQKYSNLLQECSDDFYTKGFRPRGIIECFENATGLKAKTEKRKSNQTLLFNIKNKDSVSEDGFYPHNIRDISNRLYSFALINHYSNIQWKYYNTILWNSASIKEIYDFFKIMQTNSTVELINCIEPEKSSQKYDLYLAIKSFLLDTYDDRGLCFVMLFYFDKNVDIRYIDKYYKEYDTDYIENFCKFYCNYLSSKKERKKFSKRISHNKQFGYKKYFKFKKMVWNYQSERGREF